MKRGEDMTRLDVITLALCIGGRPFAAGELLRAAFGEIKATEMSVDAYAEAMAQLVEAEAIALVGCARMIEKELDKG